MLEDQETANSAELIRFERAGLGYGRQKVLADLDLVLYAGDHLGIVGQNGTGKTTILKTMLGILKPVSGRVRRRSSTRYGYVPQRQQIDEVYPLTAYEIALMGRYTLLGSVARPSRKDADFTLECLHHVGIADLSEKPFRELSGGQKQRVLIARALATEPEVLILDEPTNDMDIGSEHSIMELLAGLHGEGPKTVVIVSHLLNVLVNYVQSFALIHGGKAVLGSAEQIVNSQRLTEIYGVPVQVAAYDGRKVVLTGGGDVQHVR
jgi:ABC-type Mn2+/Zn2+ transport system ATPase subunit